MTSERQPEAAGSGMRGRPRLPCSSSSHSSASACRPHAAEERKDQWSPKGRKNFVLSLVADGSIDIGNMHNVKVLFASDEDDSRHRLRRWLPLALAREALGALAVRSRRGLGHHLPRGPWARRIPADSLAWSRSLA